MPLTGLHLLPSHVSPALIDSTARLLPGWLQTHVTSSGCLQVIADERSMLDTADALDLQQTHSLVVL